MEKLYSTSAISVGGRDGRVRSADGYIDMNLHMPGTMGGPGGATTPEDLFAAGYAACFNSALGMVARMNRIRTGETTVKVSITLGKTESGDLQLAAEIEATVPGVEPEVAQKLTDQAHQTCPYSRATRGNIEATVTVKTE